MTIPDLRPRFSTKEAESIAHTLYGLHLHGPARPLPSERDQNFHLRSDAGQEFVLKISSAAETEAVLDLQNRAMNHLAMRKIACPQVCPTKTGERMTTVEGRDGSSHFVRLLTYLPGVPLAEVKPHTPELLFRLGRFLGQMDQALAGFEHPAAQRELQWDLQQAGRVIRRHTEYIASPARRAMIDHFLALFEPNVERLWPHLRAAVIHNDGNDYNILVTSPTLTDREIRGIIDFGDILQSRIVCDVAIALAYVMLDKADPLAAAGPVISGYHQVFPLTEPEIEVLYPLIGLRLCTSVALSAYQQQLEPDNPYLSISQKPAWSLLEKLVDVSPQFAHYTFRCAGQLPPCPRQQAVVDALQRSRAAFGPIIKSDLKKKAITFDLSVGSPDLGDWDILPDTPALTETLFGRMKAAGVEVGLGRYNEARPLYTGDLFKVAGDEFQERRTIHLGLDLFMAAGTPILAPLDGRVHSFCNNATARDYGPTIILEHTLEPGLKFYTLYGHLSEDSLAGLVEGQPLKKGDQIGAVGAYPANGDWPPHLHFQIILDMLGRRGEFPGVAPPSQRAVWLSLCPDPDLILDLPQEALSSGPLSREAILDSRRKRLGRSLTLSYKKPLHIVRGWRQYLYDETGQAYLDGVNNVCHVGHCHPRVVEAACRQMAVLNTNTRYLHQNLARYAERLAATFPDPLSVCFFVCSGSEANELALRLARTHTGRQDMLVVEGAYHGNTTALIDLSPYKFDGPGGQGAPPHVHKLAMPDGYRGPYKHSDPEAGLKYAAQAQEIIEQLHHEGRGPAGFIGESILSCGGQIVLPPHYLEAVYRRVRAAGGVCIADEVQVGFGRVGDHFWAFETQAVIPDIVTLGKPIGNGHPLAAVVTTPAIAASFANGMEYFNTFGGNPVSCAVGLAVLDVIEAENLPAHALTVGARLKANLEQLMTTHPLIGEVRGLGLFIGVELVRNRETLEPAAAEAAYIINRMKDHGVLLSTDGPLHNVLKLKPPLVFSAADADFLTATLDKVLGEIGSSQ